MAAGLNINRIDELTGVKGKLNEAEGAYRVSFGRDDVPVTVDGWRLPAFMGMTNSASFIKGAHSEAMLLAELPLFEDEVNLAMFVALESGLSVTALHNHFFFEHPRIFFLQLQGEGTTEHLASSFRLVNDKVKEFRASHPVPADTWGKPALPATSTLTVAPLNEIMGSPGELSKGMIKFTFGRSTKVRDVTLESTMGIDSSVTFAGTDDNAVVDGQLAVMENELRPTLKVLREAGINIVAIHSHTVGEEPRIIFCHCWGRGPAEGLAKAIHNALALAGGRSAAKKNAP